MNIQAGNFSLQPGTSIQADSNNQTNANYLRRLLTAPTGFSIPIGTGSAVVQNAIHLNLNQQHVELGPEGYRLEVRPDEIFIEALQTEGIFHGIQTLRQLLPVEIEERHPVHGVVWRAACVIIEDKPRFSWRGFMLDEGRHFHGMETVLQTLELMAIQKLNIFHWHLTDDQGWRIEIKKYPKLTQIGSQRAGTSKKMLGGKHDGIPHGGYYTQEEIREIIAFAMERSITIIPEIEMPGHSLAALAAYPELSCSGGPFDVATHFGIFPDVFCPGKKIVFDFMENVLDEILGLFPSPYIHIGGDEAPKKRWKNCPDCQKRIHEEALKDERALQCYFTNRIAAYLESKGRHVIGWNEILQDDLTSGAVVQFWAGGRRQLLEAIRREKRLTVMSTYLDTYLDHGYRLMPLSRAYLYEPVPVELAENDADSILGLEFPLWTEWVPNRSRLDYQTYPRLTALAETGWTKKDQKDYTDFQNRLEQFMVRLERIGVRHATLEDAEPGKIKRLFAIFTIAQPQTRIAR